MIQRQITDKEIERARQVYLLKSKPYIDRLTQLHQWLIPKVIQTENEVKVFYEETEEIVALRKLLDELSNQIKEDLDNGKFW